MGSVLDPLVLSRDHMIDANDGRISMQISAETKKISELLPIAVKTLKYVIPSFQRPYSWKNEQIEQLFIDIKDEALGYYAGNILVTGDESALNVIDGQQRLTTISLFFLAIGVKLKRDYPTDRNADRIAYDIERQLFIDAPDSYDDPRIHLLAGDQELYSNLLGALVDRELGRYGNRALFKRYKYIQELIDSEFSNLSELDSFYTKLMELEVLKVKVPELGDAFNVFSSLNSKGLPLTLIDLLKGEFISAASLVNESCDKTLAKWDKLSALLSGSEEDTSNRVVTQFLLNNYDAFEETANSSTTKSKALSQYQRLLPKKYQQGEDYLGTLLKRARVFAAISKVDDASFGDEKLDSKFASLVRLESTQAFPLLLFVMCERDRLELDDETLVGILDFLISFYVRRNIVLTPKSSNIRAKMLAAIREIGNGDLKGARVFDAIRKSLIEISASDAQFEAALDQPVYDKNKATTRYVLIDVERRIGHAPLFDKGRRDSLDGYEPINGGRSSRPIWSIEHILPEGPLPDWWVDDLADGDRELATKIQDECVHLFGNLTLTPYNSELGQKRFSNPNDPDHGSKRDYRDPRTGSLVGLRSGLYLNASIPNDEAGETLETKAVWTEEDIRRRNNLFKQYALKLYSLG